MSTLRVRKPKVILFDIFGTVVKSSFIDKIIFPYIRQNVETFLVNNWGRRVLMRDIELLRAQSKIDYDHYHNQDDQIVIIPEVTESPESIRRAVVRYVHQCQDAVRDNDAIRILRFHMLFDALNRSKLRTMIYSDVAICIADWAIKQNIALYVLSNGWSYAMRKLLSRTNHADLTLLIRDYFDPENLGSLCSPATYAALAAQLGSTDSGPEGADDILVLTHSGAQGVAAHRAGLSVIIVATHRDDIVRERTDETRRCQLPIIRSFNELLFTYDAPPASTMGSSVCDWPEPVSERPSNAGIFDQNRDGGSGSGINVGSKLKTSATSGTSLKTQSFRVEK